MRTSLQGLVVEKEGVKGKSWERFESRKLGHEPSIDCLVCECSWRCVVNASAIVRKETRD